MTASKKPEQQESFISSREWASDCLETIKKMQDEFLDRYNTERENSTLMLKILNELVAQLEKRL
jgi:hypothetical protein